MLWRGRGVGGSSTVTASWRSGRQRMTWSVAAGPVACDCPGGGSQAVEGARWVRLLMRIDAETTAWLASPRRCCWLASRRLFPLRVSLPGPNARRVTIGEALGAHQLWDC